MGTGGSRSDGKKNEIETERVAQNVPREKEERRNEKCVGMDRIWQMPNPEERTKKTEGWECGRREMEGGDDGRR